MTALDKKLGDINNQIVCKWLNVEIFHWISENFDLFETQKVIRVHHETFWTKAVDRQINWLTYYNCHLLSPATSVAEETLW